MMLRRATPPSEPFLPALSRTCIAALVSGQKILRRLSRPYRTVQDATLIAGSSAEPSRPAAAIVFIISHIRSGGRKRIVERYAVLVHGRCQNLGCGGRIAFHHLAKSCDVLPMWLRASPFLVSSGDSCDSSSL